jgi:uncharacterized protein (UPF0218 family)
MANSRSGSDRPKGWRLPVELRDTLKETIGLVVVGKALEREVMEASFLVTVGDVVTLSVLEMGRIPDISIVDYCTKRMPYDEVRERFEEFKQPEIKVRNPAGEITLELWDAIRDGFDNPRKLRIVVEGEEDLASLACISLAPENTTVIYGIPNRGATVLRVNAQLRGMVNNVLKKMEV